MLDGSSHSMIRASAFDRQAHVSTELDSFSPIGCPLDYFAKHWTWFSDGFFLSSRQGHSRGPLLRSSDLRGSYRGHWCAPHFYKPTNSRPSGEGDRIVHSRNFTSSSCNSCFR